MIRDYETGDDFGTFGMDIYDYVPGDNMGPSDESVPMECEPAGKKLSTENVKPLFENVNTTTGNITDKPNTFSSPSCSNQPLRDNTNGATFQNCQILFRF